MTAGHVPHNAEFGTLTHRPKPFSVRQRRQMSKQYGYGHRPTNNWGSGDLPAPWAEGDLVYLAERGENDRLYDMGPGYFVVTCAFSVDEGDGWYFRVWNGLSRRRSDRLHVFAGDVDYMARFELVQSSDPEGLAKRKAMLEAGWQPEIRTSCPCCGRPYDRTHFDSSWGRATCPRNAL